MGANRKKQQPDVSSSGAGEDEQIMLLNSASQVGAIDPVLLGVTFILMGLGVVMVYSSSALIGTWRYQDSTYFLSRHLLNLSVGLVALMIGMRIHYAWYKRLTYPLLIGTFFLLMLVFVPGLSHTAGGASRWIALFGFTFQPGEAAKLVAIMYLCYSLDKKQTKIKYFLIGFLPHILMLGAMVFLLLLQPDFGTSVIIFSMMFVLLFLAGTKMSYIFGVILLALPVVVFLIFHSPYRMRRILAFMEPFEHRDNIGYQISESLIALGSGGVSGMGLGNGLGKFGYVPEYWNDFIATAIGEELGLIGLIGVVGLYLVIFWRGVKISLSAKDRYGAYLAFALATLFVLQASINLGVVTGLLPTKGLTLPLISYGGSSTVINLFSVGILLNISRRMDDTYESVREARKREREKNQWEKKKKRVKGGRRKQRLATERY